MIHSIQLHNFFSFQKANIELHPNNNILVGINGSGKSNLFKAIELLRTAVVGNAHDTALRELIINKWGGFDSVFCKASRNENGQRSIQLRFIFDAKVLAEFANGSMQLKENLCYELTLLRKAATDNYSVTEKISSLSGEVYLSFANGSGTVQEHQNNGEKVLIQYDDYHPQELVLSQISEFDKERYPVLVSLKKAIRDIILYQYFDTSPNSKLRSAMSASSATKKLLPDASNLAQLLNMLKIHHKAQYRIIQQKLQDVNEMFIGFDFHFLGSGVFELMLDEEGLDSAIHIAHISDGTLRYLCLLAILLNPDRGKLICIDEPETRLHPDMLYNIITAIQDASEQSTFLIASHSENILNGFEVENIRVFEKEEANISKVLTYSESDFEGWYEQFSPGNMWRAGDLGGKRW